MTFHVPNDPAAIITTIAGRLVTVRRLGVAGVCGLAMVAGYQGYAAVDPASASLNPVVASLGPPDMPADTAFVIAGAIAPEIPPVTALEEIALPAPVAAMPEMLAAPAVVPSMPIAPVPGSVDIAMPAPVAPVPAAVDSPEPAADPETVAPPDTVLAALPADPGLIAHVAPAQRTAAEVLRAAALAAESPPATVEPVVATTGIAATVSPFSAVDTGTDPLAPSKVTIVMGKSDGFLRTLLDAGASREDAVGAIEALRPDFEPAMIEPGDTVELVFTPEEPEVDGAEATQLALTVLTIRSRKRGPTTLRWNARADRLTGDPVEVAETIVPASRLTVADATPVPVAFAGAESALKAFSKNRRAAPVLPRGLSLISGTIDSSLYEVASRQGLSPQRISQLIDIFRYTVDFQRNIRKGDRFDVLIDRREKESGVIAYASLTNRGRTITQYRGVGANGRVGYYDAEGRTNKRSLIRTPVNGARISSKFGMRRHPILGYNKMHKGVDFAAATGTAIMAAGDGVIDRIGWNGGYGRYVRIRHDSTYHTAYGHMSRFAKGLKKGSRVTQGQTIGYVGSSGRSTGPHLHFEVLKKGKQTNPMRLKNFASNGSKLAGEDLRRFQRQRLKVDALIDGLRTGETLVAQAD